MSSQMGSKARSEDGRGVVQWVVPKKNSFNNKEVDKAKKQTDQTLSQDSGHHSGNEHSDGGPEASTRTKVQHSSSPSSAQSESLTCMDATMFRTICVIIDQYIRELKVHQELINHARMRLVRDVPHYSENVHFIAHNDSFRLKIRDEQIGSIEAIKQLTNYLRELSAIKSQRERDKSLLHDSLYDQVLDIRNNIIQAVNVFVLANNDIEFPIVDPNDGRDYDLCIDAQGSGKALRKHTSLQSVVRMDDTSSNGPVSDQSNMKVSHSPIVKKNVPQMNDAVDQRILDIQKLEKDTIELRQLFADFNDLIAIQGKTVDTIESNIVAVTQRVNQGQKDLAVASSSPFGLIIPITGCVTGALIGGPIGLVIGSKLGGATIICAASLLGLVTTWHARKCIYGTTGKVARRVL